METHAEFMGAASAITQSICVTVKKDGPVNIVENVASSTVIDAPVFLLSVSSVVMDTSLL